ncbi:DUF6438 domain-containing protein [Spongiimicrobium sp. 2-473A-2-J]|uniref:DUF6438 domain-containing protein n=1 Tax=Eudoraea algarum TaxID=3417568 RepID=UPI003D3635F8
MLGNAQNLCDLKEKAQVEQYIVNNYRISGTPYEGFKIYGGETNSLEIPETITMAWGDFDHDGIEDLFVHGEAHFKRYQQTIKQAEMLILTGRKKKHKKITFPKRYFRKGINPVRPYVQILKKNTKAYLLLSVQMSGAGTKLSEQSVDTLYVKNDHLMPYSADPDKEAVVKIEFKTDYCYGTCPVFEIVMDKGGHVRYKGIDHVVQRGEKDLQLDQADWAYMSELIQNIQLRKLKDMYSVDQTDNQTGYLTVHYADGSIKKIQDYGLAGSYGLSVLYDYIFGLIDF